MEGELSGGWSPGWYDDESAPGNRRWWDGERWTDFRVDAEGVPLGSTGRRRRKLPTWDLAPDVIVASWRTVLRDRWVVWLLLAGAVIGSVISSSVLAAFGVVDLEAGGPGKLRTAAAVAVAVGLDVALTQVFVATIVAAAWLRTRGETPTLRSSLRLVWERRRQLAAWAAVSFVVVGIARSLRFLDSWGVVSGVLAELAWDVMTVFALPIVVVEGTMPVATMRRSGRLLRQNLGFLFSCGVLAAVFSTVLVLAAAAGVLVIGGAAVVVLLSSPGQVAAVAAWGVLGLLLVAVLLAGALASAVSQYLTFAMFRVVTGETVAGIDPRRLPPRLPGPAGA